MKTTADQADHSTTGPAFVTDKKRRRATCQCNWGEKCDKIRQLILQNAPDDHPWKDPKPVRVQFRKDSKKVLALHHSIAHHMKFSEEDKESNDYVL